MVRRILRTVLLRMVRRLGPVLAWNASRTSYRTSSRASSSGTCGYLERSKTPDRFRQDVCRKNNKPRRPRFFINFAKGSVRESEQDRFKSLDNSFRQQPHKQDCHPGKNYCSKKQFFLHSRKGGFVILICTIKDIPGIKEQLSQAFGNCTIGRRNIIQKQFGTVTQQCRNLKFIRHHKEQFFI